jgi:hypothetical protein
VEYGLISLLPLQLARLVGLVCAIEPIKLDVDGRDKWAILVRGRGFTRLIRVELLYAPNLIRPTAYFTPRPELLGSHAEALQYARHRGLLPWTHKWPVHSNGNY